MREKEDRLSDQNDLTCKEEDHQQMQGSVAYCTLKVCDLANVWSKSAKNTDVVGTF